MEFRLENDGGVKESVMLSDGTSFSYETELVKRRDSGRYDVRIHILDTDNQELSDIKAFRGYLLFDFGPNGEFASRYVMIGQYKLSVENPSSFF
ncbi:hypothetical protein [Liquorilactobacillus hordei]|uniref:hypothetical protein n=1 Tax=Liquorilactobacillus hordei TaxID=468911 RepID=UPI0039EBA7CB